MVIFDANMILRYLLNDNVEMANIAEEYLESDDVTVTIEVMAEVVYVLKGVYSMPRKHISETIKGFLNQVHCSEMEALACALDTYGGHNLDFIDCVLFGYFAIKGIRIATFDRKLLKLINNR